MTKTFTAILGISLSQRKIRFLFVVSALSMVSIVCQTQSIAQVSLANGGGTVGDAAKLPASVVREPDLWSNFLKVRTSQVRSLTFPGELSIGKLSILNAGYGEHFVAMAKGTVKITVPPYSMMYLDLNGRLSRAPDLLLQVPEHGIDGLQISFLNMEDESASTTDRILKYAGHLKDVTVLNVSRSDITAKGYSYIEKMQNLTSLDAFGSRIDRKSMDSVCKLTNLSRLMLQMTRATDDVFANIGQLSKLRDFSCKKTFATDVTARRLASLPLLSRVSLAGTKITDEGVRALQNRKTLTYVNVSSTSITEKSIEMLAMLPKLFEADISDNAAITDRCVSSLLKMKNLKRLNLKNTSVTYAGLLRLKPLKLQLLGVTGNYTPEQLQHLHQITDNLELGFPKPKVPKGLSDFDILAPLH